MLCIDLEPNEVEWIKNAILDKLENDYREMQPACEEIIYAHMEKFVEILLEDWRTMHVLYQKVTQ